jgi:hypothetical protein
MNNTGEPFEELENCETGNICTQTGRYFCHKHPYIEIYISEGDRFPKCDQKNLPHTTEWNKIIEK